VRVDWCEEEIAKLQLRQSVQKPLPNAGLKASQSMNVIANSPSAIKEATPQHTPQRANFSQKADAYKSVLPNDSRPEITKTSQVNVTKNFDSL
jgi:hypothetical protein